MLDLLFIAITFVFFALGAASARGCDKLSKEEQDG